MASKRGPGPGPVASKKALALALWPLRGPSPWPWTTMTTTILDIPSPHPIAPRKKTRREAQDPHLDLGNDMEGAHMGEGKGPNWGNGWGRLGGVYDL